MVAKTYDVNVMLRAVDKSTGPIRRVGRAFDRLAGPIQKADTRLKRFSRSLAVAGAKMRQVGASMALRVTAPLTLFGAMAIRSASKFQAAMNMVGAILDANADQFRALNDIAKELGATTMFTATQVAGAMKFMAMAGMDYEKVTGSIGEVLKLAAAGSLDLAESADIVTNIMAGQGIEAQHLASVVNVLSNAATSGNVDIQMMGESFKWLGRVSKETGVTIEDAAGAFALLGNAGLQAGIAGVGLRNGLIRLQAPTDGAIKKLKELGDPQLWIMKDGKRKLRPFIEMIRELEKAGLNMSDLMGVIGVRSGQALGTLVSMGSAPLEAMIEKMYKLGTSTRLAGARMKGLPGILFELASAWEALQLSMVEGEFGEFVSSFLRGLTGIFRAFAKMPAPLKKVITVLGLVLAAIAPLLMIVGFVASGIAAVGAAFGSAFVVPILAGIALVTAALAGLIVFWNDLGDLMGWIGGGIARAARFVGLGPETTTGKTGMGVSQSNLNKTEVAIKVSSDDGSTATVEKVRNKKGAAKVQVMSEGYIGRNMVAGAGG
jgi:TP901 family phage tail tape measure protein